MIIKKAKDEDAAWEIMDKMVDRPHGWIQWKGTDVCMDIHCICGETSHIDSDFVYCVKCPYCEKVYSCSGYIELIELEEEPDEEFVQICDK